MPATAAVGARQRQQQQQQQQARARPFTPFSCARARRLRVPSVGACARACGDRNRSPAQQPHSACRLQAGPISSALCSIRHG
eukprot:4666164-Prymnesium_polylepis.1